MSNSSKQTPDYKRRGITPDFETQTDS